MLETGAEFLVKQRWEGIIKEIADRDDGGRGDPPLLTGGGGYESEMPDQHKLQIRRSGV